MSENTQAVTSAPLGAPRRRRRVRPNDDEVARLCLDHERDRRRESRDFAPPRPD